MKDKVLHAKTSFLCSKEKTTGKRLTGKKSNRLEGKYGGTLRHYQILNVLFNGAPEKNKQNIRCILAILTDYAMTPEVSARSLISISGRIPLIGEHSPGTSFPQNHLRSESFLMFLAILRNIFLLVKNRRARLGVPFEIDMEGRSLRR